MADGVAAGNVADRLASLAPPPCFLLLVRTKGEDMSFSLGRRGLLRGSAASGALLTCSIPLDRSVHAAPVRVDAPVIDQLTVREITDNTHDIFLTGAQYQTWR